MKQFKALNTSSHTTHTLVEPNCSLRDDELIASRLLYIQYIHTYGGNKSKQNIAWKSKVQASFKMNSTVTEPENTDKNNQDSKR